VVIEGDVVGVIVVVEDVEVVAVVVEDVDVVAVVVVETLNIIIHVHPSTYSALVTKAIRYETHIISQA